MDISLFIEFTFILLIIFGVFYTLVSRKIGRSNKTVPIFSFEHCDKCNASLSEISLIFDNRGEFNYCTQCGVEFSDPAETKSLSKWSEELRIIMLFASVILFNIVINFIWGDQSGDVSFALKKIMVFICLIPGTVIYFKFFRKKCPSCFKINRKKDLFCRNCGIKQK